MNKIVIVKISINILGSLVGAYLSFAIFLGAISSIIVSIKGGSFLCQSSLIPKAMVHCFVSREELLIALTIFLILVIIWYLGLKKIISFLK